MMEIMENGKIMFTCEDGLFSFTTAEGDIGWFNCDFHTVFDKEETLLGRDFLFYQMVCSKRSFQDGLGRGKELQILLLQRPGFPDEEIVFQIYEGKKILIIQHNLVNRTSRQILVKDLFDFCTTSQGEVIVGNDLNDTFFCHTQNVKEEFHARGGSIETSSYFRNALDARVVLGDSEDNPFPALFLASKSHPVGLIDAAFSQNVRYRVIELEGKPGKSGRGLMEYMPRMIVKGIEGTALNPGEKLVGEKIYLEITDTNNPQLAFRNYIDALEKVCRLRGPISPLRKKAIWGSWNYGIFREVNEEIVLENTRFVKEHFPQIGWVQIDSGYQKGISSHKGPAGVGYLYPHPDECLDMEKFPHGMRYLTDKIKKMGLRPAIWVSTSIVSNNSLLLAEHPDWILRAKSGEPIQFLKNMFMLDISLPAVRDFILKVLTTLIKDWGFEGIKLDFWSYHFEVKEMVYQNQERSSLEWRNWLLSQIRSLLPEDGYLETCCCAAMGNPFLGIYADTYRFGNDIDKGDWEHIIGSIKWAVPIMHMGGYHTIIPDADSIGVNTKIPLNENRMWLSYCMMARSLVEVGGDLTKLPRERVEDLKKVLSTIDNGAPSFFADLKPGMSYFPPRIWYFDYPVSGFQTKKFIGLFNWTDKEEEILLDLEKVGLSATKPYTFTDFWSGGKLTVKSSPLKIILPPRHCRVFVLSSGECPG